MEADEDGARRHRAACAASCGASRSAPGDTVCRGPRRSSFIEDGRGRRRTARAADEEVDLDHIRPDLAEVARAPRRRRSTTRGPTPSRAAARPASARARENVADLVDPGIVRRVRPARRSPAQRRRRTLDDLIAQARRPTAWSAASARVNGDAVRRRRASRAVVLSYDYTVLAGTQGTQNHRKKDRLFELAEQLRLPRRVLHRGRRRPARRHRRHVGSAGLDTLAFTRRSRELSAARAARRHQLRPLLRRQRRAARLLRRRHRHRRLEHRHGRAGDDRGRRARRVRARGGRADERAGRPTASSTSRSPTRPRRSPSPSSTCRTSRAPLADWECADQRAAAPRRPGEPPAHLRRAQGHRRRSPTPARCSSCAATSASAWSPRWPASRAGRSASSPTTRRTSRGAIDSDGADKAARFMQLATPSTSRCSCLCDTPGIMVGPEVEKTGARAPLQPAVRHRRQPHACRSSRSCCARPTGSARRRWRAAASRRRSSPWPGRPASSAAWASRARSSSATARSSRRSSRPRRARARCSSSMVDAHVRARQGAQRRALLRDRRRDRPRRHAPLDHAGLRSVPPPDARATRSGRASTPSSAETRRAERVALGGPVCCGVFVRGRSVHRSPAPRFGGKRGLGCVADASCIQPYWAERSYEALHPSPRTLRSSGIASLCPPYGGVTHLLTMLPQPQLVIPLRRHLVASRAIGRRAAAVAGDDAASACPRRCG